MDYWDTSAILKLYIPEHDSAYFLELITKTNAAILSSTIASVEIIGALLRKERAGDLRTGSPRTLLRRFRADCAAGRIMLIPFGADVIQEAERLAMLAFQRRRPIMVRSLDLVHLATALSAKATTVVATDKRLRDLGALLQVRVLP